MVCVFSSVFDALQAASWVYLPPPATGSGEGSDVLSTSVEKDTCTTDEA